MVRVAGGCHEVTYRMSVSGRYALSRSLRDTTALAGDRIRQRPSHRKLLRDASGEQPRTANRHSIGAIVVPSARRADHLRKAIVLSVETQTLLVVLASRDSDVDEAAEMVTQTARIVASTPGCRALAIEIPEDYRHDYLTFSTSDSSFGRLSANRASDLSLKRNIGLLLARLLGWNNVLFLDDDVKLKTANFAKLAAQLDRCQISGAICDRFPDNSVVCHANRLTGGRQDVFVTGSALAVNTIDHPLPFFPDIYNEDWFSFSKHAARHELSVIGTAEQDPYNPFSDPSRAAREEFGDLLAEGLYSLLSAGDSLTMATRSYWQAFADARRDLLDTIAKQLTKIETNEANQASKSIKAAQQQSGEITSDHCVEFLRGWQADEQTFATHAASLSNVGSYANALDFLELKNWRSAEFGNPDRSRIPAPLDLKTGRVQWQNGGASAPHASRLRRAVVGTHR